MVEDKEEEDAAVRVSPMAAPSNAAASSAEDGGACSFSTLVGLALAWPFVAAAIVMLLFSF